jgi:thiamine transport system substrate-binding protein
MKKMITLGIVIFGLLIFQASAGDKTELVVMTHDSFNISKTVLETFQKKTGITVKFLKAGDTGAALNKAILSKNNPLADVFYGIDNTFMSRALKADIFEIYSSPLLEDIPDRLRLDPSNRLLPVDFGDVSLNYDIGWFNEKKIMPPATLEDLLKPELKDLTIVLNPATSSPGLAFLLTTIGHFGEAGYLDYWKKLKENGVLVTNGWEEAYWGHFTAASKGTKPIVVSYASSPAAEVFFSKKKLEKAPTMAITGSGTTFRQVEFIGILKGTKKRDAAESFIDFVLDTDFQEDIPLKMFVFPANKKAVLPDVFTKHTKIATSPVDVPAGKIMENRELWIEEWADVVLRN